MGKRLSLAGAIGVLFTALSVAPAAAADSLPANCEVGSVCIGDGASISQSAELDQILADTGITVAVVRYEEGAVLKGESLAEKIAQDNGLSELILVEDLSSQDRLSVYSEGYDSVKIGTELRDQNLADGGEAIVAANIGDLYSSPVANSNAGDGGGFPILAVVLPVVAVAALVGGGVVALKRRNRNPQGAGSQVPAISLKDQRSVEISEDLRRELDSLAATSKSYLSSDKQELREASALIDSTLGHTYELFKRIDRKKDRQNREIAQRRYLDTVKKLNSALSPDYFEDIVRKPGLWDGADEKREDVLTALRSVDRQIIENIKQVNSSKEIEFRIAVDSLIGSEPMDVDDVFGGGNGAPRP